MNAAIFRKSLVIQIIVVTFAIIGFSTNAGAQGRGEAKVEPGFQGGLWQDPGFFPIGVWLQSPRNAERFKASGINLYIGLWQGPTPEQLEILKKNGMPVICAQNLVGLANKDNPIIAGWMHDDEPDNAQSLGKGKGYGPPIAPAEIQRSYQNMRAADPNRPVLLNLGQGVAWDNYIGRGVRRNHPEDYLEYIKGADIASFDIYPVVHDNPEIAGKLEFVAKGVERLREWSGGNKRVWNCIECTHISNHRAKATPEQIRAEVWMSIIHGSRGIIYFAHQFEPSFKEAALLDDPVTLAAVSGINAQIKSLAPVLNSPVISDKPSISSSETNVPIASLMKQFEGTIYLFTAVMRNQGATASIKAAALPKRGRVEVLGESRSISIVDGEFRDDFKPYDVHLYRISADAR